MKRVLLSAVTSAAMLAACNGQSADKTAGTMKPPPKMAEGTGVQPVVNGQAPLTDAAKGNKGREATKADYDFISGMIAHHAQAVLMAGWAPTHNASASLQRYCQRVVVGQGDEIRA